MKKFFLGVFAIAGLVACVQSEEFDVQASADKEIALSGYVGSSVRGAEDPSTKVQNLDHFTVWAYVGDSAGEVFNNELVSKSGSEWTYVNPRYWMEGYDYRFFAITPYGNGVGNVEVVNNPMTEAHNPFVNGLGQINFTNIEGAEDVLYASCTKPAAAAIPEKVTFNFNHILSKVKFTFINGYDDEKTTLKIKEVKMVVPAKGYVTLNPANLLETPANERVKYNWALGHKDVDGNVTGADETLILDFGNVDSANNLSYGAVKEVDAERLTIPALDTQEYKITFTVEIWNGNAVNVKPIEASLTDYEFVSGTAYNLIATIDKDVLDAKKIEFAAEIIDWYKPTPEDHEIGYYKTADGNTYVVTSNDGLKKIAEEINAGVATNRNIVLSEDVDLNATRAASNWTPIGSEEKPFTGTFDGKGFTIKNLNIVEEEAKEGKAFIGFFGYAKNATIKNVTFENVTLDIPCLDIDHSQGHIGAVAGSLEGTSTIENVTVKGDIKVYATQSANGASRVAVIAGGNSYGNVTMENVHVIANEGSYLIANNNTGALAGQLQGKSVCKNCSSNINVTVNKFFAGGLIGLAAGDQLFENCHTTGDIAVVAGREGRAHDQYRVGGIAGGWSDGAKNVCTLVNCSYTGKVSGKNSDGSVAEPLDYLGYVGRGYTLNGCQGSKVVIDGIEFVQKYNTADKAGIYEVDGVLLTHVGDANALQAALNSEESINIVFLNDIAGEVMLAQKNDINVTIDGNGKKYDGQIKIHGNSDYRTGTTTIKNVNFETATPEINFVYAVDFGNAMRYSSNITVKDCTFTAATADVVGVQVKSSKNLVISNCTANGLHSLLQAQSCDANILVEKVTVEGGKNGISLGNTANPTIKNSTIVAREYGVRADGNASRGNLNIENTTITAKQPIVVRKVTTDGYAVNLGNGVELATAELYDVIFTKGSDDVAYVAPAVAFAYSSVKNFNVFPVKEGAVLNASSAAQLDGLLNGESAEVVLTGDVTASASETDANSGYGATGFKVAAGDVLNGNGNTITVNDANGTWDCVVAATGGTIKNVTVKGAMRGIFMPGADGDVYIDNVIFKDVIYTFNSDAGNKNYGVYISNCTINGWTSHSDVHKEVVYTNCSFGEGSGYAFCRPYGKTDFVGCAFEAGFAVDAIGAVTFENCTLGGVALTAENIATLVVDGVENVTVK